MKFNVLGVKENSVRVVSGILTIDVKVLENGSTYKIKLPPFIYIADNEDWRCLRNAVVTAYINSTKEDNSADEQKEQNIIW